MKKKTYVYRYVDETDETIKYVGIGYKDRFCERLSVHKKTDKWASRGLWRIEYFECETRSEAEAFESHLIALYETWRFYNKAKRDWGTNKYLPDVESWWRVAKRPRFSDMESKYFYYGVRYLIEHQKYDEALELLDYLEVKEE